MSNFDLNALEEKVPSSFRELYPGDSNLVTAEGEPVSQALLEYSYTRDGRREIGHEFPNPVPVEAPISQQPYEDIWVTIRRMVLEQTRQQASADQDEMETEEEADDFDVGDDFDPRSPWEEHHEPTDPWPMSTAARQLEQAINEKRSQGRIAVLQEELEALQQGKEWPPAAPPSPPAQPPSPNPAPGGGA